MCDAHWLNTWKAMSVKLRWFKRRTIPFKKWSSILYSNTPLKTVRLNAVLVSRGSIGISLNAHTVLIIIIFFLFFINYNTITNSNSDFQFGRWTWIWIWILKIGTLWIFEVANDIFSFGFKEFKMAQSICHSRFIKYCYVFIF